MVLRLEVFESEEGRGGTETVVIDTSLLEEAKLAAYDSGYSAGWEDAAAAQSHDQGRIRADLARNLQSLSFSYQEARGHVLHALEPLLEEVIGKLLPALAREALGSIVLDSLMPIAESLSDAPVRLVLNPAVRPAVEQLIANATGMPVVIEEEPLLGDGQVRLLFGLSETRIDLDRAIAEIAAAVRAFFDLSLKET